MKLVNIAKSYITQSSLSQKRQLLATTLDASSCMERYFVYISENVSEEVEVEQYGETQQELCKYIEEKANTDQFYGK